MRGLIIRAAYLGLGMTIGYFATVVQIAWAEECQYPEAHVRQLWESRAKSDGNKFVYLAGAEAQKFLEAFNAEPPESRVEADRVMAVRFEKTTPVAFVTKDGCVWLTLIVDTGLFDRVDRKAEGDPT